MDLLVRQKSAAENVDQEVEAETQDHMDHTYEKAMAALALRTISFDLAPHHNKLRKLLPVLLLLRITLSRPLPHTNPFVHALNDSVCSSLTQLYWYHVERACTRPPF